MKEKTYDCDWKAFDYISDRAIALHPNKTSYSLISHV